MNPAAPSLWRRIRVGLTYWWRHGRWPNLTDPLLFTEWVQWRKLNDRCPRRALLTDKLHSKGVATEALGAAMVVPTLWSGDRLPSEPPAPLPLVVKANHGCGHFLIVRTIEEWQAARRETVNWLGQSYGQWLDEWHYEAARRTLLVEPLLGEGRALPVDYKIYVFGGRAELVQVHEDRAGDHRWAQLDRHWRPVSARKPTVAAPASLAIMLDAAERLAAGHDFLRVDFYEVDGLPVFGEFCLFPGSGLDPFDPLSLDQSLGAMWRAARGMAPASVRLPGPALAPQPAA